MRTDADYVVVGSGLAGLYFALKVAAHGSVILVTKAEPAVSNTCLAQGGIAAAVAATDSFASHTADTLAAGDGLADPQVVGRIIGQGPRLVAELEALGAAFTRDASGKLALGREGGHSASRVVRAEDLTGQEVVRALLAAVHDRPAIQLLPQRLALDLLLDEAGACRGVRCLDMTRGSAVDLRAPAVVLATGGCGRIYQHTSNPVSATGDGVALAYRAGARLAHMEFIQFHPTVLYHAAGQGFLISEAVRGYGGILVNSRGQRFAEARHPRGSLATRDVLSRLIVEELQQSGRPCVFLDVTDKEAEGVRRRFPNIYRHCLSVGIDMTREPIPVVPAAHYMCGGVCTDPHGRTDVAGLYAVGEVAMTGLHGANRLASNSLLEAAVMADEAAASAVQAVESRRASACAEAAWGDGREPEPPRMDSATRAGLPDDVDQERVAGLRRRLQRSMWKGAGIQRSNAGLAVAAADTAAIASQVEAWHQRWPLDPGLNELRSMATVASLVIRAAQQRRESRGGHYNSDYPQRDDVHWQHPIYLRR